MIWRFAAAAMGVAASFGLSACRFVPSRDHVACVSSPRTDRDSTLHIELLVDEQAAAAPTTLRIATLPAPTQSMERILLHRRSAHDAVAGRLDGVRCTINGQVLGRLAMLDVLSDRRANLIVRRLETGQVLLDTELPRASGRRDLRWMP